MAKAKVDPTEIIVPINVIESLLVACAMGDRNAIAGVSGTIKELAEAQAPEKFHK